MRSLITSEWERLWARKLTWCLFLSMPVVNYAAGRYFLSTNAHTASDLPQYAVFGNYPVLGFEEMLMTAFNIIVIMLTSLVVTEEYRTGQLRMVMLRAYSFGQIFLAKAAVIGSIISMLVAVYFICSYVVGYFLFPHTDTVKLFFYEEAVGHGMALAYNLKFYGLGLLTLLAMIAVTLWIAVVSQTTTTAMGLGIGFYIFSLLYPLISEYLVHWLGFQLFSRIYFSSIPMIQWQGLVLMLGESPRYGGYIFTVIAAYTALFAGLAYRSFTRMDRWV